MFGLGPSELIIVFMLALLLFGGKRLPEIARGLGQGIKEFKRELTPLNDTNKQP
jgi:sec-independent protein translocase protein TatA